MLEIAFLCLIAVMGAILGAIRAMIAIVRYLSGSKPVLGASPGSPDPRHVTKICPNCKTKLTADIALHKFCADCGARCA